MDNALIPFRAETLTPFYYHGLYVPDGSATHPDFLSDTSLCFALAHAFGIPPTRHLRDKPDYKSDLHAIPWRASLSIGNGNKSMPPVRHIIDVDREGGNTEKMQKNMASGFFKKTFYVHEVAPDATYHGLLYGPDPFRIAGAEEIIVRVGVARLGMVRLKKEEAPHDDYRLNVATGRLFEVSLPEDFSVFDTIRFSVPFKPAEAGDVLSTWH
ncbi:MAG: hypothetical protein ACYCXP_06470 [Leptospirillum sp.]